MFTDFSDLKFGWVYESALWVTEKIFFMVFESDKSEVAGVRLYPSSRCNDSAIFLAS